MFLPEEKLWPLCHGKGKGGKGRAKEQKKNASFVVWDDWPDAWGKPKPLRELNTRTCFLLEMAFLLLSCPKGRLLSK